MILPFVFLLNFFSRTYNVALALENDAPEWSKYHAVFDNYGWKTWKGAGTILGSWNEPSGTGYVSFLNDL